MRSTSVAAALALAILGGAPRAHACVYGGCEDLIVPAAVLGTVAGLGTLGVLGKDLTYALRAEGQPTDFAIANLVFGLADLAGGVALALDGSDALLGIGAGFLAGGLLMVIDGVVALAIGPPRPRAPIRVAAWVGPAGVLAGVSGRM